MTRAELIGTPEESLVLSGLPGDPYVSLSPEERQFLRLMRERRAQRQIERAAAGHRHPRTGGAQPLRERYTAGRR